MQQPLYAMLQAIKSKASFVTGRKSNITTAVQLLATSRPLESGVQILADSGNSAAVYVGTSSAVTSDDADATDGFPLAAGAGMFVPVDDLNKVWLVAASGTQKVFFHGA